MARIRIQPHLMASEAAVFWSDWFLRTSVGRSQLEGFLPGWDYAQAIRLGTSPRVELVELERSTGARAEDICLVVCVDCATTGRRFINLVPVRDYVSMTDPSIDIEIPPGEVALEIGMSCHLALMVDITPNGLSASRKGSRLAESPRSRLILEGEASRFPTEGVSFTDLRLEPAAWSVRVEVDDMNQAFTGSVRLLLNTDHDIGRALASMDPAAYATWGNVVRIDIVRAVLTTALNLVRERETSSSQFDEESFGSVAEQLSNEHFGQGLIALSALHKADLARFERTIQASIGLELA